MAEIIYQINETEYRELLSANIQSLIKPYDKDSIFIGDFIVLRSHIPISVMLEMKKIINLQGIYDDYDNLDLGHYLNDLNDTTLDSTRAKLYMLFGRFYTILRKKDYKHRNSDYEKICKSEETNYIKSFNLGNNYAIENILKLYLILYKIDYDEQIFENIEKYYTLLCEHFPNSTNINGFINFYEDNTDCDRDFSDKIQQLAIKDIQCKITNMKNGKLAINEKLDIPNLWRLHEKHCNTNKILFNDMLKLAIQNNFFELFAPINVQFPLRGQGQGQLSPCFDIINEIINEDTIKLISSKSSDDIINYPNWIKVIHKLIHSALTPMELHFKYTMNGKGFEEAKTDFLNHVSNSS